MIPKMTTWDKILYFGIAFFTLGMIEIPRLVITRAICASYEKQEEKKK